MSASIVGVRGLGGNSDMERGYNCFVCGNKRAGHDLPVFVEPKSEGDNLVGLFNKAIPNCAWVDYRNFEPTYIQVKIHACDAHEHNLESLREIILQSPATVTKCVFEDSRSHSKRAVSETMIEQSRSS